MDRQQEYDLTLELEGARMSLAVAEGEIKRLNAELEALRLQTPAPAPGFPGQDG